jgi:hypothetical protein
MRHIIQVPRQAITEIPFKPDAVYVAFGSERPAQDMILHRGTAMHQETSHDFTLRQREGSWTIRWHGNGGSDDMSQPVWLVLVKGPDMDAPRFCPRCGTREPHACAGGK